MLLGDALDGSSFGPVVPESDAFVHLVGSPRPAPWTSDEFRNVDQRSLDASVQAACHNAVRHFVYVSVARPAPVMRSYQKIRALCEERLVDSGLNATILQPWYVLGPGHWWPYALLPLYHLAELFPQSRRAALRLGLVTLHEMVESLIWSVEHPVRGVRFIGVPAIRNLSTHLTEPVVREVTHR